jgi:uncharacterized protein DUF6788
MPSRTGFTAKERALYSKLRRLLSQPGLLRGNLVEMRRHCGKAGCGCQSDVTRRHRSLYLALSVNGKRRMLYIPTAWEARVQAWTARYGEIRAVLEQLTRERLAQVERREE